MGASYIHFLPSCFNTNADLSQTTWKNCGAKAGLSDILMFDDSHNWLRNDTIFIGRDSVVATIVKLDLHYGERRLLVKDFNNKIYWFCEQ